MASGPGIFDKRQADNRVENYPRKKHTSVTEDRLILRFFDINLPKETPIYLSDRNRLFLILFMVR
jgi:hypothetical protein